MTSIAHHTDTRNTFTVRSVRQTLIRTLTTDRRSAPLLARVALGILLFPHGAQHALGWFGGYGWTGTMGWMTTEAGFPAPLAALAIVVELLAPVALILGLLARPAALGLIGLMAGAITTHLGQGFFMNWFGTMPAGAEGFEYHLVVIALALVIVIEGAGRLSCDRLVARRD